MALPTLATAQPAKPPAPAAQPERATGVICNEGASGNRGVWLEVDSHHQYMTSITLGATGALDASFAKKFFPDHPVSQPTSTSLWFAVQACMPDESAGAKALISCTAANTTSPTATLEYYVEPDALTVQRSVNVTNLKLDLVKNAADKLVLTVSFDAAVRRKKVKYAFTKTFGALQQRRGPSDTAGPVQGCAVTAGLSARSLR